MLNKRNTEIKAIILNNIKPYWKFKNPLCNLWSLFNSFANYRNFYSHMRIFFFFVISFLLIGSTSFAQTSRSDLEKRRAALLNEISETQKILSETKKDKNVTLSQLKAINAKLNARQALINTINAEMQHIDKSIGVNTQQIAELNKNLNLFKRQYAQSVRYAYKHRETQGMLAFLFSANDFNDALRRMQYLKKYRDYRKDQADKIRLTQQSLGVKIQQLNTDKYQKGSLLTSEVQQKTQIEQESQQTTEIVRELQGKEKELMGRISKNKSAAQKLQNAIKAEIQKEIEIARKAAAEEARKKATEDARKKAAADAQARQQRLAEETRKRKEAEEAQRKKDAEKSGSNYQSGSQTVKLNTGTPEKPEEKAPEVEPAKPVTTVTETERPSYKLSLTPEAQAISQNFSSNRGSLPWPVASGYISAPYGKHQHPVYKSVTIENNGIDIATNPGAPVRAVFGGTIIKVTNIDGIVVMISHGEFFTVYSNLSSSAVKAGDKVSAKQSIGTAGKNDDGDNMINFQIWKVGSNNSSHTVNPSEWIAK